MSLQLVVYGFRFGEKIPKKYTCEGEDISPAVEWSGEPEGSKSFVLIMDDPDAPVGTWNHWLVWDIPAGVHSIAEHYKPGKGGQCGTNDFNRSGYGGPCPPKGHGAHRYFFRLFALDVESLELPASAKRRQLDRAMTTHVLGEASYMGRYERT